MSLFRRNKKDEDEEYLPSDTVETVEIDDDDLEDQYWTPQMSKNRKPRKKKIQ